MTRFLLGAVCGFAIAALTGLGVAMWYLSTH